MRWRARAAPYRAKERANISFFLFIMFFAVFGVIVLTQLLLLERPNATGASRSRYSEDLQGWEGRTETGSGEGGEPPPPVHAPLDAVWQPVAGTRSDSEFESSVFEAPAKKSTTKSSSTTTKRKSVAAKSVKPRIRRTSTESTSYETVSSQRVNKKPRTDLFHILRSEEVVSSQPKQREVFTSSFSSRVSTGTSRRTAVTAGDYVIDLKVYNKHDYLTNPTDVRYKTALVSVKLQSDDQSPSWEAVQGFLSQAWKDFEHSEPTHYSDKVNFK